MGTTKEDIRNWLERGRSEGATHMLVVVDTFDYEDYPVYVKPGQSITKTYDAYLHGQHEMQRVMEVYALHLPWDSQLAEHRSFHFEDPPNPHISKETLQEALAEMDEDEIRIQTHHSNKS